MSTPSFTREVVRALGRLHPLGDVPEPGEDVVERPALAHLDADGAVARQLAGAREHQIAHAREARERERVRPLRAAMLADLGEAAGDERRARVVAEAQAVDGAGRDGDHVLERAAAPRRR